MSENECWHEDDTFWETFGPVMFSEERWKSAPVETDQLVELAGITPGARVLDLCCGPGRHSLELARRGCRVTGVDRTQAFLARAREVAEAESLDVELVEEDMRRFCRPEAFDVAVNLFTAFGYFEDPAEDLQVAVNLHQSLKPGGTLVMDMAGKEWLARVFRERDWREVDGGLMLEERHVRRNWSWMENRWILISDSGERREFTVCHRLYSAAELETLLRSAGFADVSMYGDQAGADYDHKAKRLVAVARK